ncbi:hypothetical protein B0H11DRAFT_2343108 [Mycena galericulata]|nr:hypothetical protein B0H11DRAFT_2343108 [Mycena galericulata]
MIIQKALRVSLVPLAVLGKMLLIYRLYEKLCLAYSATAKAACFVHVGGPSARGLRRQIRPEPLLSAVTNTNATAGTALRSEIGTDGKPFVSAVTTASKDLVGHFICIYADRNKAANVFLAKDPVDGPKLLGAAYRRFLEFLLPTLFVDEELVICEDSLQAAELSATHGKIIIAPVVSTLTSTNELPFIQRSTRGRPSAATVALWPQHVVMTFKVTTGSESMPRKSIYITTGPKQPTMISLSSRKGFPIGNFLIRKVDLRLLLREWNQTIIRLKIGCQILQRERQAERPGSEAKREKNVEIDSLPNLSVCRPGRVHTAHLGSTSQDKIQQPTQVQVISLDPAIRAHAASLLSPFITYNCLMQYQGEDSSAQGTMWISIHEYSKKIGLGREKKLEGTPQKEEVRTHMELNPGCTAVAFHHPMDILRATSLSLPVWRSDMTCVPGRISISTKNALWLTPKSNGGHYSITRKRKQERAASSRASRTRKDPAVKGNIKIVAEDPSKRVGNSSSTTDQIQEEEYPKNVSKNRGTQSLDDRRREPEWRQGKWDVKRDGASKVPGEGEKWAQSKRGVARAVVSSNTTSTAVKQWGWPPGDGGGNETVALEKFAFGGPDTFVPRGGEKSGLRASVYPEIDYTDSVDRDNRLHRHIQVEFSWIHAGIRKQICVFSHQKFEFKLGYLRDIDSDRLGVAVWRVFFHPWGEKIRRNPNTKKKRFDPTWSTDPSRTGVAAFTFYHSMDISLLSLSLAFGV